MEIKIGNKIKTLVDKYITEGIDNFILIPKETIGTICEIHTPIIFIEIFGENAPKNVSGVYD